MRLGMRDRLITLEPAVKEADMIYSRGYTSKTRKKVRIIQSKKRNTLSPKV
jgi:hypothetical protein